MRYQVTLTGTSPLIVHNGAAGLDTHSPVKREIAKITAKRGTNRTETDELRLIELECVNALYLDSAGRPTFPSAGIRACIERAARKTKQGGSVREGLIVSSVDAFHYDEARYGRTVEELGKSTQFRVPVVVQRARVMRTRAMFELPWSIVATVETLVESVDQTMLESWLETAGCGHPSFRPGLPVHVAGLRRPLPGTGRGAVDGFGRRLLRQRDGRELLRDAGVRVARPQAVCDPRRGAGGRVRVRGRVVQHAAPPFRVGLRVAAGVRTSPCRSCRRRPAWRRPASAQGSVVRIGCADWHRHRLSAGNTRRKRWPTGAGLAGGIARPMTRRCGTARPVDARSACGDIVKCCGSEVQA